ncbi:hypothetical protein GDO81_008077 [Engystomops pustulosus]|uniref:WNT1-inducible-signaling pathway protein 3 n=1 Tax=Engystomops pustulosus TaxID=76066 RepID=A0AAV7CDK7_ENGPU|nr:hypothetical protein GDO81_008077 [Engystomops pustulosus]
MQWLLFTLLTTYYQQLVCSVEETANSVMTTDKAAESEVYLRREFCRWPCKCTHKRSCPLGVSLVKDGCGCCKICAKQLGESCNEAEVCDHHRGLYCDFSADAPKYEVGICKYIFAVGCELNGVLYQNGQSFQPSPFYTCLCISDTIGCTPMLNSKQSDSRCPDTTGLMKKNSDLTNCAMEKNPTLTDNKFIPVYKILPLVWKRKCLVQATAWSPCSKTCGMGISIRITNENSKCEMRKDRRLCFLRPCNTTLLSNVKVPQGRTCKPTFQDPKPVKLSLSECSTVRRYRPIYCGVCTDRRCCIPNKSTMITVHFQCSNEGSFSWKMMWITSCVCQRTCNDPGDIFTHLKIL